MKKVLLATIVMVALTTAAYAGGNNALFSNLKNAMKSASNITWSQTNLYKKGSFEFNGKPTTVFYDTENGDLIGFSIKIGLDELPAGTEKNIEKKFPGWIIADRILFTDADGRSHYFTAVTNGKSTLALSVLPNGKAHIYSQMP